MTRSAPSMTRLSLSFLALALGALLLADLSVVTRDPGHELALLGQGLLSPSLLSLDVLADALANTLAFALIAVTLSALMGLLVAQFFHWRLVRVVCAFLRAIHEVFWALIFLQLYGLSTLTGLLALTLPFTAIFAKVFAEILDEADPTPRQALPGGTGLLSAELYARLALCWPQLKNYILYRMECGIRSSAVLGFIGLPTLGFHLETAFKQGDYSDLSALLYLFFILIAGIRYWLRLPLLWLYIPLAFWWLPFEISGSYSAWRFFSEDIWPQALHQADFSLAGWVAAGAWYADLLQGQAGEGVMNTLLLSLIALVASGILTLLFYPLISPLFFGRIGRSLGHAGLVVTRSIPELMLAFLFLIIFGPSMLPAILALALHNGAIIGHLIGRLSAQMALRPDASRGANRYFYETTPRLYRPFLAFLFYRWEVIMRETAILGILGIHTLGFYVDSAFEDIRYDRAFFLILITAMLNIGVDALSRQIRRRLRLNLSPQKC